jgi:SAM-dependent methyltransferase
MTASFDLMTVSDIAKLAEVDISTVSNWRKRYKDKQPRFPTPVDENAPRPVFSVPEVRAWLRQQNPKYATLIDEAEKSGRAADIVRSWRHLLNPIFTDAHADAHLDEMTVIFIARVKGDEVHSSASSQPGYTTLHIPAFGSDLVVVIPDETAESIDSFFAHPFEGVATADLIEAAAADLDLSGQWRRSPGAVDADENLRSLLAGLVSPESADILDFACGTGGLLRKVAHQIQPGGSLVGIEPEPLLASIAADRVQASQAEIIDGDIITHDVIEGRHFDAVISIPPFGLELPRDTGDLARRMLYGQVRGTADAAWLQLAASVLRPNGEAYLVLPQSLTWDSKSDGMRRELVRRGLISAVVSLPPGAHADTKVGTELWVLRKPHEADEPNLVLFIDASDINPTTPGAFDELRDDLIAWMAGHNEPSSDTPALALGAMELLDRNVNLSPRYWVTRGRQATDPDQVIVTVTEAFGHARAALDDLAAIQVVPLGLQPGSVPMVSLREESIELLRPDPRARNVDVDDATPRLTLGTAEAIRAGTYKPPRQVPLTADHGGRTSEGDVIVWVSQVDRRVRAAVCPWTGLRLTGAVHAIRCHGIDPTYVALCLESSRNAALVVGGAVARPQILDMEVPYPTARQSAAAAHTVQALSRIERAAHEVLAAAQQARAALADALGSGQVAIVPTPEQA